MASKLKAVKPTEAKPSKPVVMVFGKPGVGKTFAAVDFPSVYFIDVEGGANQKQYIEKLDAGGGVYMGPEEGAGDFATVLEQVKALATEKHSYRTLVIDSITKLFNTSIAQEAERLGDKNAFGADKKPAVASMRSLVSWLNRLDMNVILIAWQKDEYGVGKGGERDLIGTTFDGWAPLGHELHLVLAIEQNGPKRIAKIRKTRLTAFPDKEFFPWSYDEFADRFGRDVLEAESQPIVLATEEQLAEVKRLLDVVKLPEGTEKKWFTAAGVESYEDMDSVKVAKIIESLRGKIAA